MTPTNRPRPGTEDLLESILTTVESIDKNVEEVLDQLSDYFDHAKYGTWYDNHYLGKNGCE